MTSKKERHNQAVAVIDTVTALDNGNDYYEVIVSERLKQQSDTNESGVASFVLLYDDFVVILSIDPVKAIYAELGLFGMQLVDYNYAGIEYRCYTANKYDFTTYYDTKYVFDTWGLEYDISEYIKLVEETNCPDSASSADLLLLLYALKKQGHRVIRTDFRAWNIAVGNNGEELFYDCIYVTSDTFHCVECDDEIPHNEFNLVFEYGAVCNSCAKSEFSTCAGCGDSVKLSDVDSYYFTYAQNDIICGLCVAYDNKYTICCECGSVFVSNDSKTYCEDCLDSVSKNEAI